MVEGVPRAACRRKLATDVSAVKPVDKMLVSQLPGVLIWTCSLAGVHIHAHWLSVGLFKDLLELIPR